MLMIALLELQMFKSWKIRSASRTMALLLPASAVAHHRRRATATESRGDVARAAEVPKDHAGV